MARMRADTVRQATILIVDDQAANVRILTRMLEQDGYGHIVSTTDSAAAHTLVKETAPDLILLDLQMPDPDGFAVLRRLRDHAVYDRFLPVLVLTADITPEARERALSLGAKDFLTKPFDITEVKLRIYNLLETRMLYRRLEAQNRELEDRVRERTQELIEARQEILDRLARAAEYLDDHTGEHTRRVARGARTLALAVGLSDDEADLIGRAAPLHDIGKIGLSDRILLKPTGLTDAEFREMQAHPTIGAEILSNGHSPLLGMAEQNALSHHQRWDGSGYPNGLAGDEIPLAGRIVTVVDVFDALLNERPYKPAWPVEKAIGYIRDNRGTQFDPHVADRFLDLCATSLDEFLPAAPTAQTRDGYPEWLDRR
jgi:putative two-component system response regulator